MFTRQGTALIGLLVGCSASTGGNEPDATPVDVGTEVGDADVAPVSRTPPPRPSGEAVGTTQWFVVDMFRMGLTMRDGTASAAAWRDYGYDLDGRYTSPADSQSETNTCKRDSGASSKVLSDGTDGTDNNFGQHVLAVIKSLAANYETGVNNTVRAGTWTWLVKVDNFTTGDNAKAPGALYAAANFAGGSRSPSFAETETGWSIVDASLVDRATVSLPRAQFPKGYVANGYWVSGEIGATSAEVILPLFGGPVLVPLESAVISFRVADGSDGTLAGAVKTTKFIDAWGASLKSGGVCPGSATYDQLVDTITQSADLVSGLPGLQSISKTCDALSIGVGFSVRRAGGHSSAPIRTTTTPPSKCP